MSYIRIGQCSLCGGSVMAWDGPWWGITAPVPECSSCGALRSDPSDPVIPMVPKPSYPSIKFTTAEIKFNCVICGMLSPNHQYWCTNNTSGGGNHKAGGSSGTLG